jgi:hypothetical protein
LLVHSVTADRTTTGNARSLPASSDFLVHAQKNRGRRSRAGRNTPKSGPLAAPVIGDLDADGLVEVVVQTREGYLYAWRAWAKPAGRSAEFRLASFPS